MYFWEDKIYLHKIKDGVVKWKRELQNDDFYRQSKVVEQTYVETCFIGIRLIKERQRMPANARVQEETSGHGATDYNKRRECSAALSATEEDCNAAYHQSWGNNLWSLYRYIYFNYYISFVRCNLYNCISHSGDLIHGGC